MYIAFFVQSGMNDNDAGYELSEYSQQDKIIIP